jgi:integrase
MLSHDIARYVDLHRSMGFKFRTQEILLRNFGAFADRHGDHLIHTSRVLAWAAQAPSPPQRHNRLATVRRFALAMRAESPRHEVPPAEAFGRVWFKRCTPHIYSAEQITRLLDAAANLAPKNSIRSATFTTLFALLAATGIRVSEALALELEDLTEDGLLVRATKFRKNRLVPLHDTARQGLLRYQRRRIRMAPRSRTLFISMTGNALSYGAVNRTFLALSRTIGLRGERGQRGPRIHDLRHTFAVRSLEQCAGSAAAVARHAVALSTYLGHAHVSDTYWYLQATPILMRRIAQAGESLHRGDRP